MLCPRLASLMQHMFCTSIILLGPQVADIEQLFEVIKGLSGQTYPFLLFLKLFDPLLWYNLGTGVSHCATFRTILILGSTRVPGLGS